MTSRANPFGDLGEFQPKPKAKPVERAQIDQLANASGFPSRQPAPPAAAPPATFAIAEKTSQLPRRRYTTGRNQQLNIKAKPETIALFYKLADQDNVPLGELLERALANYEKAHNKR